MTATNHVASAQNGQPKKRLVLNAFVEMCTQTSQLSPTTEYLLTELQAPAIKVPASGNTLKIDLQTLTP